MEQPTGGRTGGVYIPPFKLALLQKERAKNDPASAENQKLTWEALRKSLNGLINKVNVTNIKHIVPELFQENLIRGRGLFARAIMKAQLASPGFTHIYSSLIAVINTKLPENGELILKRIIISFKRAYKRRDKITATALAKFMAHLVNHQVAHELLALQILTVLLEEPTDDSVEIAVNFVKEVGQILEELSPQGLHAIFERFRGILHEGDIDKRVQYTIEGLFAIRKSGFKDYPAIPKELDLVEREDQITFEMGLDDEVDKEEMLDIFRVDPNYLENEALWEQIQKEVLGGDDDEDEYEEVAAENGGGEGGDDGETPDYTAVIPVTSTATGAVHIGGADADGRPVLNDQELINLRRSIYLTIMSSVSFEECCHKLMKLNVPEGYETELCNMLVECCSNERSFLRYYGLMGQRFCMMHKKYQSAFDQVFLNQYTTIHRLETNKLRNVAKFFGHLLSSDALPWTCFEYMKLNERDTTSSSRIFIKVLIQELSEIMGLATLKERFGDSYMQDIFGGLFPTDNARDTRFSINFFTSIGLGYLTEPLRKHLKNAPKLLAAQMQQHKKAAQSESSSSSSSSSDSSSDSDSDSDSSSSSSGSSSSSDSDDDGSSSDSDSSSSSSSSSSSTSSSAPSRRARSVSPPVKHVSKSSRPPADPILESSSHEKRPSPPRHHSRKDADRVSRRVSSEDDSERDEPRRDERRKDDARPRRSPAARRSESRSRRHRDAEKAPVGRRDSPPRRGSSRDRRAPTVRGSAGETATRRRDRSHSASEPRGKPVDRREGGSDDRRTSPARRRQSPEPDRRGVRELRRDGSRDRRTRRDSSRDRKERSPERKRKKDGSDEERKSRDVALPASRYGNYDSKRQRRYSPE